MDLRTVPIEDAIVLDQDMGNIHVLEYQPGNGTRYVVMLTDLNNLNDRARDAIGCGRRAILVTLLTDPTRQRSVVVHDNGLIHWTRMERIIETISDQVVLAEFAAFVLQRKGHSAVAVSCEEYERQYGQAAY